MIRSLLASRFALLAAVVALLGWLVVAGRHVTYEQSLESFFPSDDPAVVAYKQASEAFGNDNIVFVSYDDPDLLTPAGMDRLADLARGLAPGRIEAVVEVQSLDAMPQFWRLDEGLLTILALPKFARGPAIEALKSRSAGLSKELAIGKAIRDARDPKALSALKERITRHPLLQGTVVGEQGTSTAVVVRLKGMAEQDPLATVASLRSVADDFAARHKLGRPALVGPPVLLADGFAAIERDGKRLAAAGMLLIGLVTLAATQSLWWAIVPILAGWTVWLAAEHVMASLGQKLSLSGGPLVAQIIVLTMPAASHLAVHFRVNHRKDQSRREAAVETIRSVTRPILWCAITGAIGYAALLTSNVMPVFQFGAVLASCTLIAAVLTLAISPSAMLPPFPLEVPVRFGSKSRLAEALNLLTRYVVEHPRRVVAIVLLAVVPLAAGMGRLQYESNYINAFSPEARVVRDYNATESRLGGIGLITLVVPYRGMIDGDGIRNFASLDAVFARKRMPNGRPPTARTISLATIFDPDGKLLALPKAQADDAIALKLALVEASPQAALLRSFWNPSRQEARILARVSERQEAPEKQAAYEYLRERTKADTAFGPYSYITGLSYLLTLTTEGVIATQWSTICWAVGSILVLLSIAFRSVRLAALAILPTILAVAMVLGLMGWLGVRLDIATALVGSVALGLSVDDTFHCLLQYRRLRETEPFREALYASYAVSGPGVLLSSLAVAAGFAVLRFSEFAPFSNFGTMVGVATLGSSLGNLVLLPACLALGEKRSAARRVEATTSAGLR